jgi:hypothetical protein
MTQLMPHNDIQIAAGNSARPSWDHSDSSSPSRCTPAWPRPGPCRPGQVRMAGGHHALPHIHAESEIQVCVVRGKIASLVGPDLTPILHGPGSLLYIAPGVEHVGVNVDAREPAELVEFRTDPAFNKDVVPITGLNALAETRVTQLRREYILGRCDEQLAIPSVNAVTR